VPEEVLQLRLKCLLRHHVQASTSSVNIVLVYVAKVMRGKAKQQLGSARTPCAGRSNVAAFSWARLAPQLMVILDRR